MPPSPITYSRTRRVGRRLLSRVAVVEGGVEAALAVELRLGADVDVVGDLAGTVAPSRGPSDDWRAC